MNPAITILDYLWRERNWLKHHENCTCSFEDLATKHIERTLTVDQWAEVVVSVNFGAIMRELRKPAEEWSELCGPAGEARQVQDAIEAHANEMSRLMTWQASRERQTSD